MSNKPKTSVVLKGSGDDPPAKVRVAIVNSSQLGNCWSPARFCGGRCARVESCTYPERDTCHAVEAEKKYLRQFYLESHKKLREMEKATFKRLTNIDRKRRENGHKTRDEEGKFCDGKKTGG